MPATKPIKLKPDSAAIGRRLRLLREARGCPLRTAAKAIGLAGCTLSLIENGRRQLTIERLVKLAAFYRRSLPFILFGAAKNAKLWEIDD